MRRDRIKKLIKVLKTTHKLPDHYYNGHGVYIGARTTCLGLKKRPDYFFTPHWQTRVNIHSDTGDRVRCDTAACLAGWAAHLALNDDTYPINSGAGEDVRDIAEDYLELEPTWGRMLFINNLNSIRRTPQEAIYVLQRMLNAGAHRINADIIDKYWREAIDNYGVLT